MTIIKNIYLSELDNEDEVYYFINNYQILNLVKQELESTRVIVNERILRWAMERSCQPEGYLEQKFPKIWNWVKGEIKPTMRELEKLARATSTPFGYFFLSEPPEEQLSIPHFRTTTDNKIHRTSPDLLETVQIMERRQAWMRETMLEEGQERRPFIRSADTKESPHKIAENIRQTLGLEEEWASKQSNWGKALQFLKEAIESIDILVVVNSVVGNNNHRKLDYQEFRGFVLVDEYAPLIFVNGADFKAAQMFTYAHELAHLWFGASAAFDLREMRPAADATEQACNKVAAEFLVPEGNLRRIWTSVKNKSEPFQILAKRFKVSEIVIARRALDLNLIDQSIFFNFYDDYTKRIKNKPEQETDGGSFYNTQNYRIGKRFANEIFRSVKEGRLLYRDAYHLTELYGKTFSEYATRLGYGGV